jgi:hypothetical protein
MPLFWVQAFDIPDIVRIADQNVGAWQGHVNVSGSVAGRLVSSILSGGPVHDPSAVHLKNGLYVVYSPAE